MNYQIKSEKNCCQQKSEVSIHLLHERFFNFVHKENFVCQNWDY